MLQNEYATVSGLAFVNNSALFSVPYQGLQLWTVPETATYRFHAKGGHGGPSMQGYTTPGRPVRILNADFDLNSGEKLLIAVGQRGGQGNNSQGDSGAGGGGATFICKYVSDSDVTPLVVASGGNGEAWSQWNTNGPDGRTSASWTSSVWWSQGKQYGRGAFGGGFNLDWTKTYQYWSNPPTASQNMAQSAAHSVYQGKSLLNTGHTGSQTSSAYTSITTGSLEGGNANGQSQTPSNAANYSGTAYGFGGFGGGGGSTHEGAGGGGYWGGAAVDENQYNNTYAYGGVSYINTSLLVGSTPTEAVYTGAGSGNEDAFYNNSTEPHETTMGYAVVTKL